MGDATVFFNNECLALYYNLMSKIPFTSKQKIICGIVWDSHEQYDSKSQSHFLMSGNHDEYVVIYILFVVERS